MTPSANDFEGPKPGENWTVFLDEDMIYVGMAWDIYRKKHLVFKQKGDDSDLFVISKDEFYRTDTPKRKVS